MTKKSLQHPLTKEEMDIILWEKRGHLRGIRVFDFLASALGLMVLSPILILLALLVKFSSKGPILYRQRRVGLNGRHFFIKKFRTMRQDADKQGTLVTIRDDRRITGIGKFLRKAKLDEIPQLFNVLVGEMSLVGPRPEVPYYVKHYDEAAKQLLRIRPGITDLASIAYHDEAKLLESAENADHVYILEIMPAKHALNFQYVREMNLWYNIKLIFKTIGILSSKEEI